LKGGLIAFLVYIMYHAGTGLSRNKGKFYGQFMSVIYMVSDRCAFHRDKQSRVCHL